MRTCVHEYGRESEVQKEEMIPSHRVFLNMGEGRNTSLKFAFVVWGRDTRFVGKKKRLLKRQAISIYQFSFRHERGFDLRSL
jgi:hypothetical protein